MRKSKMQALIERTQHAAQDAAVERRRRYQQGRTETLMRQYRKQEWHRTYIMATNVAHEHRSRLGLRGVGERLLGPLCARLEMLA